jgi:AcrR family transcriptional regulator
MQDIAEAVHLQKASLYHHVSSKQEILVAVLDNAIDLLTDKIQAVLNLPLSPEEKLHKAIEEYLSLLLEKKEQAVVLLLEHRSLEPRFQEQHIPRRDRFEVLWRKIIEEGTETGIFICSNPAIATKALLGIMNWTITWYRPEGPLSPEDLANQYTNLFLFGLLTKDKVDARAKNYNAS